MALAINLYVQCGYAFFDYGTWELEREHASHSRRMMPPLDPIILSCGLGRSEQRMLLRPGNGVISFAWV